MIESPALAGLLAEVYAEVCRHLDIAESTPALLSAIQGFVPAEALALRRWDEGRSLLDVAGHAGVPRPAGGGRSVLPSPRREELQRWAEVGQVHHWMSRAETGLARTLLPEDAVGPWCAGPLVSGGELLGVALLGGELVAQRAAVQALLPPLAAALANDRRLSELARLREAAEQDKQALLTRLGREDVSGAIVGAEAGLREVMVRVDQVAPTDVPVLILGETGSGKEVLARAVHTRSRRAQGPFLRVNCGAIPSELVDSELFGHEKGSFTGAVSQRKGWFERADGGTLFLDEVGELPPAAQVRLLRVLQDGTFQRVGGQGEHSVDVRIVAATHRDMATMVQDGRFRRDLWYRISVFPLSLPALRERRGDVPALAAHFADRAGVRLYGRRLVPTDVDVARLVAYPWPGNVRELAAVIERAAILGNGHGLDVATALGSFADAGPPPGPPGEDRSAIEDALRRSRGRIEGPFGAASALGVNPHTLRSRMRRLGIEWERFRRLDAGR